MNMRGNKKINLQPLKRFVVRFPTTFVTRYLIESEQDFVNKEEFLVKSSLWLKTLRWDLSSRNE